MEKFNEKDLEYLISILENTSDIYLKISAQDITPQMNLKSDLGLDSLGKINLFYEISDALETEDDEEETLNWKIVKDVLVYINDNIDDAQ